MVNAFTKSGTPLSAEKVSSRGMNRIASAGAREFSIIPIHEHIIGYRNREDISTSQPNTLVVGSQDVLTNTFGRIFSRAGYTLDGTQETNNNPVVSFYDWLTHRGGIRNLKAIAPTMAGNDGKLMYRYVSSAGVVSWKDLMTGLSSSNFNFATWWNTSGLQEKLLMVNGDSGIYDWSGGVAVLASATNSTNVISTINTTPVYDGTNTFTGGSGYTLNDTLTVTGGGGTLGTVTVEAIQNGVVTTVGVGSGGTGYNVNDIVIVNLTGPAVVLKVATTSGGGVVTSLTVLNGGSTYSTGGGAYTTVNGTGTTGINLTVTITATVNGAVTKYALKTGGTGYSTGTGLATSGGTGSGAKVDILTTKSVGSITISGTPTIGELNFNTSGNLKIGNNIYTYSAFSGYVFSGINTDPSAESVGSIILQPVGFTPNTLMTSLPSTLKNGLIANLNNQVYVGDLTNQSVYVSKLNSYTDYSFGSPRAPGDGALFVFDAPTVGMIPQENSMYFSCGTGFWYVTQFTLSADLTKESLTIIPLKTGLKQGVFSQALMWKMPNDVAFVTNEPVVRTLGRVSLNLATPEMVNVSASIVNDMNNYDFTGGSGKFFNEFLYVALPAEGIIRIYNMTSQDEGKRNFYWEAPQTIPVSGFMDVGDGNIYGHSALTNTTFKLFSGSSDNGHPISSIAKFPQITFGTRHKSKSFFREYVEGYISQTTALTCQLNFIGTNKVTTLTKTILGTNTSITVNPMENASIGKVALGKNPIGSDLIQNGDVTAPNLAVYLTFQRTPFFKVQPVFSSLGTSQEWQLLAIGFDQSSTTEGENIITL